MSWLSRLNCTPEWRAACECNERSLASDKSRTAALDRRIGQWRNKRRREQRPSQAAGCPRSLAFGGRGYHKPPLTSAVSSRAKEMRCPILRRHSGEGCDRTNPTQQVLYQGTSGEPTQHLDREPQSFVSGHGFSRADKVRRQTGPAPVLQAAEKVKSEHGLRESRKRKAISKQELCTARMPALWAFVGTYRSWPASKRAKG